MDGGAPVVLEFSVGFHSVCLGGHLHPCWRLGRVDLAAPGLGSEFWLRCGLARQEGSFGRVDIHNSALIMLHEEMK
jgi:hypothetical protein